MGKPTGFLEIARHDRGYDKPEVRKAHWQEFVKPLPYPEVGQQAARCMDCGIPFCHQGCPVNNMIPDWNNLVYRDHWREASETLHSTNNFPEFTGRICPAPCEASCTLNIEDNPVTIKTIECAIVDRAFEQGWLKPEVASLKTGQSVAIVGAGPAGLAVARDLAPAGYAVTALDFSAAAVAGRALSTPPPLICSTGRAPDRALFAATEPSAATPPKDLVKPETSIIDWFALFALIAGVAAPPVARRPYRRHAGRTARPDRHPRRGV